MDEFVLVAKGSTKALVHPAYREEVASALLEGEGCQPISLGGRGSLQQFPIGDGTGLVRQYRRGGLARLFLRDQYLLVNRPLRELKALLRAQSAGVSVPEPLGVAWKRTGPAYSGSIATIRLEGVTLLEYVNSGQIDTARIEECGRAIRKMHDSGIYHADLQIANIIVGPSEVSIIDFDNARAGAPLSRLARSRNLLRLGRSFAKNDAPWGLLSRLYEGYGEFRIPRWLATLYSLKGLASDALSGRRPKSRYGTSQISFAFIPSTDSGGFEGLPEYLCDAVPGCLDEGGEILKESEKFWTRRVGHVVVKETRRRSFMQTLKSTLFRKRYRRAWEVAHFLKGQGILVPTPIAYAESGALGFGAGTLSIVTGSATVSEFLDGYCNVEEYGRFLERESPADRGRVDSFLSVVADAVNALTETGAYHSDLSGKNIFTADGRACTFIDLEAVHLNRAYTRAERLKNHVQLYDSFCDLWDEDLLGPFIAKMTPEEWDDDVWFAEVREAQRARRSRHVESKGMKSTG